MPISYNPGMKTLMIVAGMLIGMSAVAEESAELLKARHATIVLGKTLKGRLMAAVEQGSFTNALAICQEDAPEIADDISGRFGLIVRRTSDKLRNPDNAPDAWEKIGLEKLTEQIATGANPSGVEVLEVVTADSGETVFRYMKPIMTAPLCLTCHGEQIEPSIAEALSQRYPEDQATGYKKGEMRGAFSVVLPIREE